MHDRHSSTPSLTLEQEMIRSLRTRVPGREYPAVVMCVPRLIALLNESPDRPTEQHAEAVRRILAEPSAPGVNAMEIPDPRTREDLLPHLLREMEHLRHVAIQRGIWSPSTSASHWFG